VTGHGPCGSRPAQDVNILNNPHGDVVESSSRSYELSLFSSKAGSDHDVSAGAAPGESSSMSMGDLCPRIKI
jgi:hypothetical protein